jgi:hypothetical protein
MELLLTGDIDLLIGDTDLLILEAPFICGAYIVNAIYWNACGVIVAIIEY